MTFFKVVFVADLILGQIYTQSDQMYMHCIFHMNITWWDNAILIYYKKLQFCF